jgi:hypothetical protein
MRWQERKLEDDLLKRELLLRLRAEHYAVPGRSRPATEYFRRQVRSLVLRRPLFGLRYRRLATDLSLGRLGASERDRARWNVRDHSHTRAVAGVLAGVLLAAAAATAVVVTRNFGSGGTTAAAEAKSPLLVPAEWWHPPRPVSTPAATRRPPRAPRHVERRSAKAPRRVKPTPERKTVLVSDTFTTVASGSGRPTPLAAPKTASTGSPSPLRAPRR